MRVTLAAVVASLVVTASAHATVYGVWINGVFKGDGRNNYIRSPPNNNPVKDITSDAVACNVNNRRVPNTLDVKSGDKFTFEWYHDKRDDDIIASSHKGPVVVYIAPASSNGAGDVWVKLYEESWDGTWAVDKIIAAHGQHSINIPNLPAGEYLLISPSYLPSMSLTLVNPIRGIQLYPSCVQVRVTSNGSNALPTGVSFPGAYAYTDYGIHFNLYNYPAASYVIPGPAVWSGAAGGSIGQVGVAKVAKVAA